MHNSERNWVNHEEGPLKYVSMTSSRQTNQHVGESAIKSTAETSERDTTRQKAKKALLGVALAALTTVAVLANRGEVIPGQSLPKEQWEEAMDRAAGQYYDSRTVYSEDGSLVEITSGNTHYTLNDTDNDAAFESGSAVREGRSADFANQDGISLNAAISNLNSQIND